MSSRHQRRKRKRAQAQAQTAPAPAPTMTPERAVQLALSAVRHPTPAPVPEEPPPLTQYQIRKPEIEATKKWIGGFLVQTDPRCPHGTMSGHSSSWLCRCPCCKAASRAYQEDWINKVPKDQRRGLVGKSPVTVPPEQLSQELLEFYDTRPLGGTPPNIRGFLDLSCKLQEVTEFSVDPTIDEPEFFTEPEVVIMNNTDDSLLDEIKAVQELLNDLFTAVKTRISSTTTDQTPAPAPAMSAAQSVIKNSEQRNERIRRVLDHLSNTNQITTYAILGAYAFESHTTGAASGRSASGILRSRSDWKDQWRIIRKPPHSAITESWNEDYRRHAQEQLEFHGFHLDSEGRVLDSQITSLKELYHDLGD